MSKFDENLFGRIALLNNYLTKEELERCIEVQREGGSSKSIGQVLLEEGYLTSDQLGRILDIRKKKVRRFLRSADDSALVDRELGRLLLARGLLDLEGLESAVLEQQYLRQLNLHFSLSEVLVSRGQVAVEDIQEVYVERGWKMGRCPTCDGHFRVVEFSPDEEYRCPRCQTVLESPAFLDSVMVDGVIGGDDDRQPDEVGTDCSRSS